jgi:TRAP-type C4-dicarboxylate transport system permease small subunit
VPTAAPFLSPQERERFSEGFMKNIFEKTIERCLVLLFLIVIFCIAVQVFYRYALNHPLPWTEELAKLAFIWMLFLGLFLAERDNIHIAVDFFLDRLPLGMQKPVRIAVELFGIVVLFVVSFYSFRFIEIQKAMRSVALNISMMYFALPVPIGCILYGLYKFSSIKRILNTRNFRSTADPEAPKAVE